jgi:hypothetical protein
MLDLGGRRVRDSRIAVFTVTWPVRCRWWNMDVQLRDALIKLIVNLDGLVTELRQDLKRDVKEG